MDDPVKKGQAFQIFRHPNLTPHQNPYTSPLLLHRPQDTLFSSSSPSSSDPVNPLLSPLSSSAKSSRSPKIVDIHTVTANIASSLHVFFPISWLLRVAEAYSLKQRSR
ncbi:hypothetical protein HAX54_038292 [Datura stramonium]|uniref:Uncharacterized protein n=1 Tax=Datura stramonium TaxID=4076 RepID=A0ABS8VJJ1_DATST|nr:hypothetical protein [Datura stramonium]